MKTIKYHRILSLLILFSLFPSTGLIAQVPENCKDIMLQGFYWDSQRVTSWKNLNAMAEEIGQTFDLIWLPPSAKGESFTGVGSYDNGYHPKIWSDQTSAWGTQNDLIELINTLKKYGCRALADIVVNHRAGNTSWCDFVADDFGRYGTFQLTATHICQDDEVNTDTGAGNCKGKATGAKDTGENWCCARDLDHTNVYVQENIEAYLKWLKDEIGYEGWRYDFVKGFDPAYVGQFNDASAPYFSVGEYWDGSYNLVTAWINKTEMKSAAFDFPGKYNALNNGLAKKSYGNMSQSKRPAGIISNTTYNRYGVTFVDNHDTYRDDSKYTGDVPQAYAFILSAPGVPCVFWPHWTQHKSDINNMVAARKMAGIHSQSESLVTNTTGYYECETIGTCGSLICRIGEYPNDTPQDYQVACQGDGWTFYIQKTSDDCDVQKGIIEIEFSPEGGLYTDGVEVTITASGTYAPFNINYTIDGTMPDINSTLYTNPVAVNTDLIIKAIAVDNKGNISPAFTRTYRTEARPLLVKALNTVEWSELYIYAWDDAGETAGEWPGTLMEKEEDSWYSYSFADIERNVNLYFHNNAGKQSQDVLTLSEDACFSILNATTTNNNGKIVQQIQQIDCNGGNSIEQTDLRNLTLYPNPTADILYLSDPAISQIQLTDISGTTLFLYPINGKVDLSGFEKGLYIVSFPTINTSTHIKVIKK